SLILGYLDDLGSLAGSESGDRRPREQLIQDNAVVRFLKDQGYTIVALPSGYNPTTLRGSDIRPEMGRTWNELEVRLLCSTPIPWLAYRGSVFDPVAAHRQKILFTLEHIADTVSLPDQQFVFAHVLAPHGPFVFDENGNGIDLRGQFDLRDGVELDEFGQPLEEDVLGYTGQLAFVNTKIRSVLEALIAQSSRPTIVILQSDHGPSWPLNMEEPGSARLRERMSILNAYLLPGENRANLYEEITPVNTFRLIFNAYLGTDLELLEDRSYYSTWAHPYRFVDVTDEVRAEGPLQATE
ncbi:MAG: sulfatase-like hydrolase/transferase, partial [Anaerolineae bacterium]